MIRRPSTLDLVGPTVPATVRLGRWRVLVSGRRALISAALVALGISLLFVTLGTGPLPVTPAEVMDTMLRRTDEFDFVVLDIGLPRGLVALMVGAALGAAGSLVQALTRNPLGSPDVIGFDSGASLGALVGLLLLQLGDRQQAAGFAIAGGAMAALMVFVLSAGGRDAGFRIVLIGIGIGAMFDSASAYILTRSDVPEAMNATRWLVGSLNSSDWADVVLAGIGLLVLLPAALALARPLRLVLLGPEVAPALGVNLNLVTACSLAVPRGWWPRIWSYTTTTGWSSAT